MPVGSLNCPSPEPALPSLQLVVQVSSFDSPLFTPHPTAFRKVPSLLNSSRRWPVRSATQISPDGSRPTATGSAICPTPVPFDPTSLRIVPVSLSTSIRPAPPSATYTLPVLWLTVMPSGSEYWPFSLPCSPYVASLVPAAENT